MTNEQYNILKAEIKTLVEENKKWKEEVLADDKKHNRKPTQFVKALTQYPI